MERGYIRFNAKDTGKMVSLIYSALESVWLTLPCFIFTKIRLNQKLSISTRSGLEMHNFHSIQFKVVYANFSPHPTSIFSKVWTRSTPTSSDAKTQHATSTDLNHPHPIRYPMVRRKFRSNRFSPKKRCFVVISQA